MLSLFKYLILTLNTANCLVKVSENNYFDKCFATIAENYLRHHTNIFIGPKFKEMDNSYSSPIKLFSSTENILNRNQQGAGSYSISYDSVDELNETFAEVGNLNLIHFIIIANDPTELSTICKTLWQYHLYKSVILLPTAEHVELYVLDLKNSKCGTDIKPKKINQCVNGVLKKKLNLFSPDIQSCFKKCPLKIIWSPYSPWIYGTNSTETGVYEDILSIYQEKTGFDVIYMPENEAYSEDLSYYNFQSIILDFDRNYADIFLGLVGFSATSSYVWTTGFVYEDDLYFVLPNPKRIPYYKLIFKLFLPWVWVFNAALFFILCVLFTLLALTTVDRPRFNNLINNIIYLYSLSVHVGLYKFPRNIKLRLYLGGYLYIVMIIVAIVEGKYFSFISSPRYEKRTTSLDQLLETNIPIKLPEGLKVLFLFPFGDKSNARVLNRLEILTNNDFAENLKQAYNENFATITDRGLLIMHPYLKNAMQMFKIFSFITCFLIQKNHVLYEHFTTNLTTIVESGFVQKSVSLLTFKYSRQQFFREENTFFRLTLSHVEAPFLVLAMGYFLALSCLVAEKIYYYFKTVPPKRIQFTI